MSNKIFPAPPLSASGAVRMASAGQFVPSQSVGLPVLSSPEGARGERLLGGGGADVAAHDGLRSVAGVLHDVALVDAGLGEGGDAPGAQAVRGDAGECRVPEAGLPGPLLQDQADALGGQGMAADRVRAGDPPEHRAILDPGRLQPGAQGRDRAVRRERVGGDVDDGARPFLVGLGAGQEGAQPVRAEGQVGHPDPDQLRAAEGAGKAEEEERAVALAAQAAAAGRRHPDHVAGEQRRRPALRRPCAVAAGGALQGLAQLGVLLVEGEAEQGVRLGDGGEPAGEGRVGPLAGEFGQVVGDQGRGGGGGAGAVALAPRLPGAQVAAIGPAGGGGERLAGVGGRRFGQRTARAPWLGPARRPAPPSRFPATPPASDSPSWATLFGPSAPVNLR
jgi:hypothetical protein